MAILKYEFKKILSNKPIVITIIILIAISIIGFYSNQYKYNEILIKNIDRYYELQEVYKEDLDKIDKDKEELNDYQYIYYMYILDENNRSFMSDEDKEIIQKFNNSIYVKDINKLISDITILEILSNEMNYVNSYDDYLKSIQEDKDRIMKASIFHKKGTFSYNNVIKTAEDFKKIEGIKVEQGIEKGINAISNYKLADILIIIIILILAIGIFSQERENEALALLKSNKRGRVPLITTKVVTFFILVTIIITIIYISISIAVYKLYGFGDLSRSIQSISKFRECDIIINVKQYLEIFLILKIIISLIISAIFSIIIQVNKETMKSIIGIIIFTFISYIFYRFIGFNNPLNSLKYINIFSYLNVGDLIGSYTNINIFTKAVNILSVYKLIILLGLPTIVILNIICFSREREIKGRKINVKLLEKIKTEISKKTIPSTLFLNEVYKIIIENKVYIIIIIAIIVSISNITINEERYYDNDTIIYKNYVNKLSGPLTQGKEMYLENEYESLMSIGEKYSNIEKKLASGSITESQYSEKKLKLQIKEKKIQGFSEIYSQYEYLKNIKKYAGINGYFIDKDIKSKLFNDKDELESGLYLTILLIIALANVFAKEYKTDAIILIQSSRERNKMFLYKYIISSISSIVLLITVCLPNFINVIYEFGTDFLKAPVQSIEQYMYVSAELSIVQFLILESIFKVIGVLAIVMIILSLSNLTKNNITTVIISMVLLLPGVFMKLMEINLNEKITLANIFNLNQLLSSKGGVIFNLIYFISIFIVALVITYISYIKFKNKKLSEKRCSYEFGNKEFKQNIY